MELIIVILATWRLSSLIAGEDGPWNIFLRLRLKLGFEYDKHSKLIAKTELAKGMECPYCNSIWIASFLVLPLVSNPIEWLYYLLAVSAGAIIVDKIT